APYFRIACLLLFRVEPIFLSTRRLQSRSSFKIGLLPVILINLRSPGGIGHIRPVILGEMWRGTQLLFRKVRNQMFLIAAERYRTGWERKQISIQIEAPIR